MIKRTLYLESFAGIAGDMFTAAFLDAGLVDPEAIRAVPGLIHAPDVKVEITNTQRAHARFTNVSVVLADGAPEGDHHHYHYPALVNQLEKSDLGPVAKEFALRVFRLLAEAEADSHGVPVEKVTFHEVGAVDSVVDVAMAGVCVATVGADRVLASPVKLGRGTVQIQHGTYPVPPPASARLAVGMPVAPVPDAITRPNVELSTPTGLAILKALDPEFAEGWPSGTLLAQGSGAGTRDLGDYPNVFRVVLVEESLGTAGSGGGAEMTDAGAGSNATLLPYETDQVFEVRCNVDDQTGERTAWIMEKGLELGALDAWVTPLVGKKGRPAACMTFLVKPEDVSILSDFLLRHSSSFGVRYSAWDRFKLCREEEVRDTPEGPVSFKIGRTTDGEKVKEKPEFE
ncbi:MAG: LarC family nickel insertion protein, partial [Gemmatimonadota bacterium]